MTDDKARQIKTAVAALATCFVRAAQSEDAHFESRFLTQLGEAYDRLRYGEKENLDILETLNWTKEMITGFNFSEGQKEPFLPRPE